MRKQILCICFSLAAAMSLFGCSSSRAKHMDTAAFPVSEPSMAAINEITEEAPMEVMPNPGTGGSAPAPVFSQKYATVPGVPEGKQKITYQVNLSLQTVEFDDSTAKLPEIIAGFDGIVQDSYIEGSNIHDRYYARNAHFTARVPTDRLDVFVDDLRTHFHFASEQRSSSDISSFYYDTELQLDALHRRENRLTELLESATELEQILQIEQELANVSYEIQSLTSSINNLSSMVDFSTVTIQLQEVSVYEEGQPVTRPVSFGDRVQESLHYSLDNFVLFFQGIALFLIILLPFLPIIGLILLLLLFLRRKRRKQRANQQTLSANSALIQQSTNDQPESSDTTPPEK